MIAKDEKSKSESQGVWTEESTIQPGLDSCGRSRTRRTSPETGHESFATGGVDRERSDITDPSGQRRPGKIVDRLILKTIRLIEESEARTADLRVYLAELRDLYAQIQDAKEDSK